MTLFYEKPEPDKVAERDVTLREAALREATKLTTMDRNRSYGPPEDSFSAIADVWNWWLAGRPPASITALDVAEMLSLMKKARRRFNPSHKDSYVDDLGYVACAAEIAGRHYSTAE